MMLKAENTGASLRVAVVDLPETHEHQTLNTALVGLQIDGSDIYVAPPEQVPTDDGSKSGAI